MNDSGIYRKTEKGRTEIATRANRLGMRERTVLIMVDDRTARSGFLSRSAHPGTGDILDFLQAQGYIELVYGSGPVAASPAASIASPAAAANARTEAAAAGTARPPGGALSPELKDALQRTLAKYIGPMAEIVCSDHFERASDPAAVAHALANEIPGDERATQFRAEVARMLDSGKR